MDQVLGKEGPGSQGGVRQVGEASKQIPESLLPREASCPERKSPEFPYSCPLDLLPRTVGHTKGGDKWQTP